MYGFSAYAIPVAITAALIIGFGASLIVRRRDAITRSFFIVTSVIGVWLTAFTFMYLSRDRDVALIWAKLAYLGVPLIAPAIYQFTVEVLQIRERRRVAINIAWGIAVISSAVVLFTNQIVRSVDLYWWGYYPRYTIAGGLTFLAYFFGYLIAALVEFIHAFPASTGVQRTRIKFFIIGFSVAYLCAVDFLPKYGVAVYPFGYLLLLAFLFIVARSVRKFDLLTLTSSFAAPEIVATIADALFVCDADGMVQLINPATRQLLGCDDAEVIGKPLHAFISNGDDVEFDTLRPRQQEYVFTSKEGQPIEVMLSVAPLLRDGGWAGAVMIARDIRERKRADREIRQAELRYRTLFEQNAAGVCVMSEDGTITDCNATFASLIGAGKSDDLKGLKLRDLYARPYEFDDLFGLLHTRQFLNGVEAELVRGNGGTMTVLQNLAIVSTDEAVAIHATVVDISARKRAEEQIEFNAYHDVLTKLPNRKLFSDRLSQNLTHAKRANHPIAVMYIDIDRFKKFNDLLGHEGGDELLLEIAARLRHCVREEDTVARIGGDEFAIIITELRRTEDAIAVAQKILEIIQLPISMRGTPVDVTASIGVALYPVDGADSETLLLNADKAMDRAKEAGRNTYQLCTDQMKKSAMERMSLEARLRRAINEEQLLLVYQPQIDLTTGRLVGVEALVRWNDPEKGIVSPASFIPVAEESRLILPLGAWVLRAACKQMRYWIDHGIAVPRVAVNLSARQFQQHDLVATVREALAESTLDGSMLELEITETTAMQNAEATASILRSLRDLGVGISIDDFGTGYSSLNYLKRFPINAVKIDRAFVSDAPHDESDAAIVSAVIGMARSLKLRVIAEGLETAEQLAFLQNLGCDEAQGFYFSRPVAAADIATSTLSHVARIRSHETTADRSRSLAAGDVRH